MIGAGAFGGCAGLEHIVFNDSIDAIGDFAFSDCTGLSGQLTIPSNVATIGEGAFVGCDGLTGELIISPTVKAIEPNTFKNCLNISGPLHIPDAVEDIESNAFRECHNLNSLLLPPTLENIGAGAFYNCHSLSTITAEMLIPPALGANSKVFFNVNKDSCTLYVPAGTRLLYATAPQWKDFKHIIEGNGFWLSDTTIHVAKFAGSKGTAKISVFSNTVWTPTSDAPWISVDPSTATSGNGIVTFTALTKNPYITPRTGTVTISAPGASSQKVTVIQDAGDPEINITVGTGSIGAGENSKDSVAVPTNTTWTATSDQSWLHLDPSVPTTDSTLVYTATTNPDTVPRIAIITISAPGAQPKTILITQAGKTPLRITPSVSVIASKVYDKTTTALFSSGALSGKDSKDDVQLLINADYENSNVGTNKTITVKYSLTGKDASKYAPPKSTTSVGEIVPLTLDVLATSDTRTYDGGTVSSKTPTLTGKLIAGDSIITHPSQKFDTQHAGTDKKLIPYGMEIEDGNQGLNYLVKYINANGIITALPLTVTAQPDTKSYDGNTSSSVTPLLTGSLIMSDKIDSLPIQKYDTRKIGTGKVLTPSGMVINDGNGGKNYTVNYVSNSAGVITRTSVLIALTASARADDKEYDGTTVATLRDAKLNGVMYGDDVKLDSVVGDFIQKNVGVDISINVNCKLIGADIDNYTLIPPTDLKADITPRSVSVTGCKGVDKIYDGTDMAQVQGGILTNVISGDDLQLTASTFHFVSTQSATGINITTKYGLQGLSMTNYKITQPTTVSASILPKQISVTLSTLVLSKIYDGTDKLTYKTGKIIGVLVSDSADVALNIVGKFDNALAGTNKNISLVYSLSGSKSANYIAPAYTNWVGEITPKRLTATVISLQKDKMQDGTTVAKILTTGQLVGLLPADQSSVSLLSTANYDNSNVGTGKSIRITHQLTGALSSNYLAPIDSVITDGRILDQMKVSTLKSLKNLCEGEETHLEYNLLSGDIKDFKLRFDTVAHKAGFVDQNYQSLSTQQHGTIKLNIPAGVEYGEYKGYLRFKNILEIESEEFPFSFTVNLADEHLVHKFGDVIICDNIDQEFLTYQWYKDGVMLPGANKQFYYEEKGLVGEYSLQVTTTKGEIVNSCSKTFNLPKNKVFSIYPNPSRANSTLNIHTTGYMPEDYEKLVFEIYDNNGLKLKSTTIKSESVDIQHGLTVGVYTGKLIDANGNTKTYRILIQ